jgi:uncharacterized protein YbcV (DUF1398 family)
MRRFFLIPEALTALLMLTSIPSASVRADVVSSCPAVIKNAITLEMLMSEGFLPFDVTVGGVGIIDTVDTVDTISIDAVNPVIVDTVNTINTVIIDTIDTVNKDIVLKSSKKKYKIKFGRRAAFNHSQVSDVLIRVYSHDGEKFSYEEYRNQAAFGIGFEVAGVIDWVLSDEAALNFSPGVVFRKPINTAIVGTSEVGVSFPVLLEWGPFGGGVSPDVFAQSWSDRFDLRRLHLFGGIWVGAPLYAQVKWNGEESAPFKDRAWADFGLVCGAGVYVSDKAFIDVRGIFGVSRYDSYAGRRLNQLAIGANYVK